jgi:signal transduction histidine kinase
VARRGPNEVNAGLVILSFEDSMAVFSDEPAGFTPPELGPSFRGLRWLLLVVCGTLLALLLASGITAVHFLGDMHAQELSITHALAERTQMLLGLWVSVQGYRQAVEQIVSAAQADRDQAARQHLDQLTLEVEMELRQYPSQRDSEESVLLRGIEDVFSQQRSLYIAILTAKPQRLPAGSTIDARRASAQELILGWPARLRAWNGERLRHADRTLVAQFANVQRGLARALAIVFGSGLLLASAGMGYIVRLERQTRARYVELARSRHDLQELSARLVDAQETERRAISRELHDEIGQSLGALLVDIGRLSASSSHDTTMKKQLDHMKSVAERSFQAVRNIALLLRPSMLDDLGLAAALEWLGREVSRTSEIEVTVVSENVPEDLPDQYRVCIYRLVQAALHNAVQHSGARNATIRVDPTKQGIRVQIADDGRGFDPGRTRGLGLLGMVERVKRLGGSFRVESQPGKGTTVVATLPSPPAEGG